MLNRSYNALRPNFSKVLDTQEYHEKKIKEIDQGLMDIANEKNPRLRADITKMLLAQRKVHLLRLSSLKEENIKNIDHDYDRAYKELFHFFKFPLVKRRPQTKYFINDLGQKQIQPFTEYINFQGVELEVTYYGGELGDPDRMVWLAVMGNAIRYLDFVKEFGWIPYSTANIARDAKFGSQTSKVSKSLRKLRLTDVEFKTPFGGFAYDSGGFHMIDTVKPIIVKKLKAQIYEKIESKDPVKDKLFIDQAQKILYSIQPRTPKINLVSFHKSLMDAIVKNQITTVDNWALNRLSDVGEKTLFLYFYDVAQWWKSNTPKRINLLEIMDLSDIKLHFRKAKGKEYPEWKRAKDQIETFLGNIKSVAKFIIRWEWVGEKENTWLHVYIDKNAKQIPSSPKQ